MAGVEDGKNSPKEDTLPETPASKGPVARPSVPDDWKPPPRRKEMPKGSELVPSGELDPAPGARVDFAFGHARVRTYKVTGPLAFVLTLAVLALVGAVLALVIVFAVGVGAALAAGTVVAAALGIGVAGVRRLAGGKDRRLDQGDR